MVKIVSDSTCDLPRELAEKYDVKIIPLHILLGDKEYEEGTDITPKEIFAWADANKTTPKTSAISVDRSIEVFKPILDNGDEIIAFCISETMSTSGNSLRLAAMELNAEDRVHVIDSKNLSTGIALMVIEAAIAAAEGKSADEIIAMVEELIPKVRSSFVVDTLLYLYRGGRCSGLVAMAGGLLKLHPKIVVEDGVMHASKKYRGAIEKVTMAYVKDMEEELKKARPNRIFITHSQDPEKGPARVREYLESLGVFDEILTVSTGGVISSHCGPDTLGVLFIAGE